MDPQHNKKILDLIYSSVVSEGGDGDAVWLSKHTSLKELMVLIDEYNVENNTGWDIEVKHDCLHWGAGQEWVVITNDKNLFKGQPSWIILKIDY